jgi:hypothetical protein
MKPNANMRTAIGFCFLLGLAVISCMAAEKAGQDQMQLTSTAFTAGMAIPAKHTCYHSGNRN